MKTRGRGRTPNADKKQVSTPTIASKLKVKMNFVGGRKRKGQEDEPPSEKVEKKTTPAAKRRKLEAKTPKATPKTPKPLKTPKAKATPQTDSDTPKRRPGRPPKHPKESPVKLTMVAKMAAQLKQVTKKKKKNKAKSKVKKDETESNDNEQSSTIEEKKESDLDLPALEIAMMEESPRKRRTAKKPGRFTDKPEVEAKQKTPKTPRALKPEKTPGKKKAPPKPKRKSIGSKNTPEVPKRDKELEDEVNLIASLTAQIESAEKLVAETADDDQAENIESEQSQEEPMSMPSPETLVSKPHSDAFGDHVWTPTHQSSRYSGRKITPKIRSSPEEDVPTPRRYGARGRGRGGGMHRTVRRQNSKQEPKKRKPPVPPKPRRKSKSESHHAAAGSESIAPPPPPPVSAVHQKPHLSEDLLVNSEITEQSYEEFLSIVESGSQLPDPEPATTAAAATTTTSMPKKTSPKSGRVPKRRTTSESEIKLGGPVREAADDVIHTPPPTSPLVPSDDHSYSLSSRKYPALSMPPRSQAGASDEVVPRFVSVPTTPTDSSASLTETVSKEVITQQIAMPGLSSRKVVLGGRKRRSTDGSDSGSGGSSKMAAGQSLLIPAMIKSSGQPASGGNSGGQSVLAQVLSRPQEYTKSQHTTKKSKSGAKQVVTQIVSKEGKVVYAPQSGGDSVLSGSQQVILTTGSPLTLIKQPGGEGGRVLVRRVGQQGFTNLSSLGNQRVVLATSPQKQGPAIITRLMPSSTATMSTSPSDATVVTLPTTSMLSSSSSDEDMSASGAVVITSAMASNMGNVKFLYAGSSPPHTSTTPSSAVVTQMISTGSELLGSGTQPTSSLAEADDEDSMPGALHTTSEAANGLENLTDKL